MPKIQVFNTALITAQSGMSLREVFADRAMLGRLTESAVGAHLLNAAAGGEFELFYWRQDNYEVDFVLRRGKKLVAIEVKSGKTPSAFPGLDAFAEAFKRRGVCWSARAAFASRLFFPPPRRGGLSNAGRQLRRAHFCSVY